MLLGIVFIAIILLLILITKMKINPFISLMIVSFFVGLATGMPLDKIVGSIQAGLGNTLGFIAIVLALGTMLGKLMEESGAAERVARTLIDAFGKDNVHWAMMFVAFIVGIPVFFQVGFVLLLPLVFTIAKETGMSLLKIGLPLVAGLSVVHGLVPPHPAAMAAVGIFKADVGKTILYSIIVGLPTAVLAGPVFATFISKKIQITPPETITTAVKTGRSDQEMPGFGITVITILFPVFLMLLSTISDIYLEKGTMTRLVLNFIGNPITSLLISVLLSLFTFGLWRGFSMEQVGKYCDQSLPSVASILMVIGGGGAFNKVLLDSGVGTEIAKLATSAHLNPIILGWLVAALIRVATGSATVAMLTAAGIVAPILAMSPGTSPELMVLAVGAGSLVLSHVNDAGFWMIKEYFGMTVQQTLSTWTVLETIIGVAGLAFTLLLATFIG
ncbi:GntP family permease [Pelosinus sp. sgz500959]|uniref:GntP family permease n=1 Tax=Pelosinus sp. sgz500959 TaxID=3242472 RepID=UPI00366E7DF9